MKKTVNLGSSEACFNCERTEMEVPTTAWHFQGKHVWVCSQCMPLLIHKLDQVLAVWNATKAHNRDEEGGDDGADV